MSDNYTQRVSSTQLPSAVELLDILTKESQRYALRYDFIQNHTSIFDIHRQLSSLAHSDDSWIDTYTELSLDDLVAKIQKNHDEVAQYIAVNQNQNTLYEAFYTALIPNTEQTQTEAIFVFGAATNARIERGVELYEEGIAKKIIISGNGPHYVEGVQSEASRMGAFAQDRGVPAEHLLLEEESVTLPDNVKRTIDLLEELDWKPKSLAVVATNFVLTRAMMEWYKFCPWDITIIPVAAHPQSPKFTAEGWSSDEATVALVLNEYAKIFLESKVDLLRNSGEIA